MASRAKPFDLDKFLSTVNGGRTLVTYRNGETVFAQGDPVRASFTLRAAIAKSP